jgi:Na+-transporting methylmalonyl-CoA/oxaloacetate decarboxylase gamma subunit
MMLALQYSLLDGLVVSIVSIVIVYAILYLITLAVRPLKRLEPAEGVEPEAVPEPAASLRPEDVDDDMMAAILTACIDYRNETRTDVRVVSAKEIRR